MAELAVVVTVAAIFLVPPALGKGDPDHWPEGELGRGLDLALLLLLGLMLVWVGALLLR